VHVPVVKMACCLEQRPGRLKVAFGQQTLAVDLQCTEKGIGHQGFRQFVVHHIAGRIRIAADPGGESSEIEQFTPGLVSSRIGNEEFGAEGIDVVGIQSQGLFALVKGLLSFVLEIGLHGCEGEGLGTLFLIEGFSEPCQKVRDIHGSTLVPYVPTEFIGMIDDVAGEQFVDDTYDLLFGKPGWNLWKGRRSGSRYPAL